MYPPKDFKTPDAADRLRLAQAHLAQYYSLVNEKPTSVESFKASPLWTQELEGGYSYESVAQELADEIGKYQGMKGFIDLWQGMFTYFFGGVVKSLQRKNSQAIQDGLFEFAMRANLLLYWAWMNRMFWRYDYHVRRGGLGLRYMPEYRLLEVFFGKEVMSIPVDFIVREVWLDIRETSGLALPNAVHGYLNIAAGISAIPVPKKPKAVELAPSASASGTGSEPALVTEPVAAPAPAPPLPTAPPPPSEEEVAIADYFGGAAEEEEEAPTPPPAA